MTINKLAAMGGIAFLASCPVGPRIAFERPNEGAAAVVQEFKGLHADIKAALEETGKKHGELDERLSAMEQKLARGAGGSGTFGDRPEKSIGYQVASAPELDEIRNKKSPTRVRLELKTTITTSETSAAALMGTYTDQTLMLPRKRLTVRDLIPAIQITENSVEYPRQTTRTNNAAPVAEGATKPESAYAFDMVSVPTRVIAHWVPASRQILDDAPQLAGIIDGELRDGLAQKEEAQILNGDGTGESLFGLVPQATAYSAPIAITSPTSIDLVGLALLQNSLADYPADAIVLHPSDWMYMRLLKNADGEYLLGDPAKNVSQTLFGLPVVTTTSMAVDKFLVGNFRAAATVYDRWQARVEIATEHADFFIKNLVAILAEERLALAVKRPLALTYGDFGRVS